MIKSIVIKSSITILILIFCVEAHCDITKDKENTLVLNYASAPTSIDPHYMAIAPNVALSKHIYDTLFYYKASGILTGKLAENYNVLDDLTWEINLKKGIFFHNGDSLEADDIVYTFNRILQSPNTLDYKNYLKSVDYYTAESSHKIIIKTKYPDPNLPSELSTISILNKKNFFPTTNEIDTKNYANGTGPFRLIKKLKNNEYLLERNNEYIGTNTDWKYVRITSSKNKKSSIQSFINGEIDVIEKINPLNITNLKKEKKYNFTSMPGNRLIYLYIDVYNDYTPYIKSISGEKIPNPLKNKLVRKALSMAIDRNKICADILHGAGEATLQYVGKSNPEYDNSLTSDNFDPEQAKALLIEAGYPNGFYLTLHGPNDRYISDKETVEAIVTMFNSVGIITSVETLPKAQYFKKAHNGHFSLGLAGWEANTGRLIEIIEPLIATYNSNEKTGMYNSGRYSNTTADKYIKLAKQSFDVSQAIKYSKLSSNIFLNDYPIIPLHIEKSFWAMKKNIKMLRGYNSNTFALNFVKYKQ